MTEKKGNNKNKKGIYTILMLICAIVFFFALYKVVDILVEYKTIDNFYDDTRGAYIEEDSKGHISDVLLSSLISANDDIKGWIYIEGTDISYPVLQGPDNDYYLFRAYNKQYLVAGSIFMESLNNPDFTDDHTVIFGHNMHNGSMFGQLDKFFDEEYMKEHSKRQYTAYEADEDAVYEAEYTIDLSTLEPTVAFPHLPENTKTISEIGEPVVVDQSVIGSCTNGRIDDLRVAARILKGRKVKKGLRCIVIPATQAIYLQAMEEGLLKIFIEAGAVVSTPTCGPCLGGYMGILAAGERCISTTNRNFVGRMGHVESEVYLASPAVAAASAVTGYICAPEELGL